MNRLIRHPLQLQTRADRVAQESSPYSDSDSSRPRPYLTGVSNAPTVESTENGTKKLNDINGQISADCRGRLGPPLDLIGGRPGRFLGARTTRRALQILAVIDSEIGAPAAAPTVSSGGVKCFVIPRRGSRR